jgi:hypothetical protein
MGYTRRKEERKREKERKKEELRTTNYEYPSITGALRKEHWTLGITQNRVFRRDLDLVVVQPRGIRGQEGLNTTHLYVYSIWGTGDGFILGHAERSVGGCCTGPCGPTPPDRPAYCHPQLLQGFPDLHRQCPLPQ